MVHLNACGVGLVLSTFAHVGSGNHGDMVLIHHGKRHDADAFILETQVLFKLHLTIRVNPQQVNPLKSLHIDETMVELLLALYCQEQDQKASPQPCLNCLGLLSHLIYLKFFNRV